MYKSYLIIFKYNKNGKRQCDYSMGRSELESRNNFIEVYRNADVTIISIEKPDGQLKLLLPRNSMRREIYGY